MGSGAPSYQPFGGESWRDPFGLYRRLRDEDPVHRSPAGFWVLSRFADVFSAARDTETFSSAQGLTFINEKEVLGLAPTVVIMDPPDHTRFRRLVNRGFTPRRVAELEVPLRHQVRRRVDRLAAAGQGDLIGELAQPVPAWLVARYLGVPDEDQGRFAAWTDAIVQAATGVYGAVGDALDELNEYFTGLVALRRRRPGDDMVSDLIRADADGDGVGLEGILGYAFVMIAGGNDTTTGLIGGAAELLTTYPDQRRRLREDPGLLPGAVEEMLRLTSPVQGLCRVTTRRVELGDRTLEEGERVLLCYGSANRDPREFGPAAESFDGARRIERLLVFSSGAHFCLGASAARLMGRVVVDELLTRCPDFMVDPAAGVYAGGAFTRRFESLPFVSTGL